MAREGDDSSDTGSVEQVLLSLLWDATLTTDINQPDPASEKTALHLAAENGNADLVAAVLECGADVNLGDVKCGITPLYAAAYGGHLEVILTLLRAGAGVNQRCWGTTTELYYGHAPLYISARNGHIEVVMALLEAGAEINQADNRNGSTALWAASWSGHAE
eukprot:7082958-Pyramimonas_sp.AAC.1